MRKRERVDIAPERIASAELAVRQWAKTQLQKIHTAEEQRTMSNGKKLTAEAINAGAESISAAAHGDLAGVIDKLAKLNQALASVNEAMRGAAVVQTWGEDDED